MRIFLAVVEARSMSGAARALGLAQPTMSRRIAELEERLGYNLFRRLPSGVAPTSAAERLLVPARKMAEWAGEIGRTAAGASTRPEGIVRITAPPGVAWDFLTPFAAWLKGKQPKIEVQVLASVGYLDLVRGEADLALRMQRSTSPDLKVVTKVRHPNAAFVSKRYAKKLPKRYGFADVDWLAWAPPHDQLPPNPQLAQLIPGFRPSFASDNFLILWRACEAGLGAFVFADTPHRFRRGEPLLPLDLDLGPFATSEMHLMCARTSLDIPRVRIVAELLAEELGRIGR